MDRQDNEFEDFLKRFQLREVHFKFESRAANGKHTRWLIAAGAVAAAVVLLLWMPRWLPSKEPNVGRTIRTDERAGTVLALPDDSRVEMRAQSEMTVDRVADGIRIHLNRGSVIVNAAKQGSGHLYVQTKDCTVSVIGTVFLVETTEAGSRVAVIQGEVHVQQGAASKTLQPGEQVATAPSILVRPLIEEIAWSQNAVAHAALLQQAQASLQFEAASLKPATVFSGPRVLVCNGNDGLWGRPIPENFVAPKGRCVANSVSLMWLISGAYFVPEETIYGGPNWIHSLDTSFRLDAKAAEDSDPTTEQLREMLRNLLAERFKLKLHRETREMQGYQLLIGKNGHKLRPSSGDEPAVVPRTRTGGIVYEMKGQPISSLVDLLVPMLRLPVMDRTSLPGIFNFSLTLTRAPGPKKGSELTPGGGPQFDPPIPEAVQEQLGLRLESKKVPAEVLVVDYAEKPSEN
jgi:uncharacterized protein (TIGR03435 family)